MQKLHAKDLTAEIIDKYNLFSITGDDRYYLERAEGLFVSLIEDDFRDFNLSVIDNLTSTDQLADAVSRYPSFSEHTVVIVRDGEKKKELNKEEISSIVASVPTWCKLVAINSGVLSAYDSLSMINVSAERLNPYEIKGEIKSLFPKGITPKGIEKLAFYANRDMGRIAVEAEKLTTFAPDRSVNEEDVELLVTPDDEHKIFEFTNAVLDKNVTLATGLLDRLLKQGLDKGYILSSLITQYRRLFYAAASKESDASLATMLGVKEFAVVKLRETARKYSAVAIRNMLNTLTEIEYAIRRGDLSEETGFGMAKNALFA